MGHIHYRHAPDRLMATFALGSLSILTGGAAVAADLTVQFGPPIIVDPSIHVGRMAVADFNLDDQLDLAVIEGSLELGRFMNSGGALSFAPLGALDGEPFDPRISAADLNGDDRPDIVAVTGNMEFQTFIQQPGGGFKQISSGIPGEFYFPKFVLGRMNDDDSIDLVTANPQGVHLNDGSGDFITQGEISFTPIFSQLHAARLNHDERADVLRIFGVLPAQLQVMRNDGAGVLTLSAQYSVPNNTDSAVGDFNADGITDIAMIDYAPVNAIVVRLGQPNATLAAPLQFSTGPHPSRIAAGDVNGDGFDDIIVAMGSLGGAAQLRSYLSLGDGTFQLGGSASVPVNDSGGGGPHVLDLAARDFNSDGRTDLAAACVGYGLVLVLNVTPIAAGDITGDGIVNVNDLLAVIGAWGPCPAPPALCPADIAPAPDGDGIVDVNDLLTVIGNWD